MEEVFEVVVLCTHGDESWIGNNVMPITCQPGDKVSDLKRNIERISSEAFTPTARPTAKQVLVCWGEELQDDTVLSELQPKPSSIVMMMRDTEATLDNSIDMPKDDHVGMTADALFQMIRQLPRPGAGPAVPTGPPPEADPAAVAQLAGMGFPEERAKKALLLNGNSLEAAMDWLFQHADDADVDVPLTPLQLAQLAGQGPMAAPGLASFMGMLGGGGGGGDAGAQAAAPQPGEVAPEVARMLPSFDPLLEQIATVANGDASQRAQVEQQLPTLQNRGWQLSNAVQQLWQGTRDLATLQRGVDANSAALIQRMLETTTRGSS